MIFSNLRAIDVVDVPNSAFQDVATTSTAATASLAAAVLETLRTQPDSAAAAAASDAIHEQIERLSAAERARLATSHERVVATHAAAGEPALKAYWQRLDVVTRERANFLKATETEAANVAKINGLKKKIGGLEEKLVGLRTAEVAAYEDARAEHVAACFDLIGRDRLTALQTAEMATHGSDKRPWGERVLADVGADLARLLLGADGAAAKKHDTLKCLWTLDSDAGPLYVLLCRDLEDAADAWSTARDNSIEIAAVVVSSASKLSGGFSTTIRQSLWRAAREAPCCAMTDGRKAPWHNCCVAAASFKRDAALANAIANALFQRRQRLAAETTARDMLDAISTSAALPGTRLFVVDETR